MAFDFDRVIDRRNTYSYKWDQSEKLFGEKEVLPLWVADMDFQSPPAVTEAIQNRAAQGLYGYTITDDAYASAITGWYQQRHGWEIQPQWITDTPGVVPAIGIAVQILTQPGDQIIVQSPVYYPFYQVIEMNERQVVKNPLRLQDMHYEMDFEQLEGLMKGGARTMILCNPHNPGGRVWTREELTRLGELCLQYGVKVISDDIHADITYEGHPYVAFASLSEELANITVTCLAPTKTFNIPGIHSAFTVIPNDSIRRQFDHRLRTLQLHMKGFFEPVAVKACYEHGAEWLDELIPYLQGNIDFATRFISEQLPELKVMQPEATYLLWVDANGLGLSVDELKDLMFHQAKVAFSEGSVFGDEAQGFLRINLACPRSILQEALERFAQALRTVRTSSRS